MFGIDLTSLPKLNLKNRYGEPYMTSMFSDLALPLCAPTVISIMRFWASICSESVSYTHLDVYKRQDLF